METEEEQLPYRSKKGSSPKGLEKHPPRCGPNGRTIHRIDGMKYVEESN